MRKIGEDLVGRMTVKAPNLQQVPKIRGKSVDLVFWDEHVGHPTWGPTPDLKEDE